jgi:diguanylate cyclase
MHMEVNPATLSEADAPGSPADVMARLLEQGRAEAARCAESFRLGQLQQVQQQAQAVLPLLQGPQFDAERHETLRLLVMAASETGAFDLAFDAARRLVRESAESNDDGLSAVAAFALACCFERVGDAWQAVRVLSESLTRDGDATPPLTRIRSLNALCAILLGNWHRSRDVIPLAEAEALLMSARRHGEQALQLLPQFGDPVAEVVVRGNLAEVLLHLGERQASAALLAEAMAASERAGQQAFGWRLVTTQADSLLSAGDAAGALACIEALLQDMGDDAPPATAVRAHDAARRACRALGHFEAALHHFEVCERLERRRTVTQLRAQSELFVTRSEAEHARRAAERARREASLQSARAAEYEQRAEHDALTGLGNRRHLERRAAELLPLMNAEQAPLALAELDLDHFKRVNDERGHAAGDVVLVALAQLLRDSVRGEDVLVRMGGEEFVLVMPRMSAAGAVEVCERLRQRVAAHRWAGEPDLQVTLSIGLVVQPPRPMIADMTTLIEQADAALYRAKAAGRNRVEAILA